MELLKVAIVGASGYSGEELIRLLTRHRGVELCAVTSRAAAGQALGDAFPKYAGTRFGKLALIPSEAGAIAASGAKVAMLALPHGLAHEFAAPLLDAGLRVIDLSADFRIRDAAVYADFYGHAHPAPQLLPESVYGMPELYRHAIKDARLVASPGCYPTSIILPLHPVIVKGVIRPESIVVTSLSGVSGAGRKSEVEYSFAETHDSARQYGVPRHRHLAEIEQELAVAAGHAFAINFTPHLIPLTRGILSTIHVSLAEGAGPGAVGDALNAAYDAEPFVRLLGEKAYPDIKNVAHTNFIDIAWRHDPRTGRVILMSAEDNLVKGASGQAVQSLNIMAGFAETDGLS